MMRLLRALAVALATVGCHSGARLATFAPARGPAGIQATVDTTPHGLYTSRVPGVPQPTAPTRPLIGELLAVDPAGLHLLTDTVANPVHLFWVSGRRIRKLELHQRGRVTALDASVRRLARFPQGMSDELLRRLLQTYGIDRLEAVADSS